MTKVQQAQNTSFLTGGVSQTSPEYVVVKTRQVLGAGQNQKRSQRWPGSRNISFWLRWKRFSWSSRRILTCCWLEDN